MTIVRGNAVIHCDAAPRALSTYPAVVIYWRNTQTKGDLMQCIKCSGTGVCQPCRGSGRSGYSSFTPRPTYQKPCGWCKGTGRCDSCAGSGNIASRAGNSIEPHIFVLGSQRVPRPIFAVALTGARWRYLSIPHSVLRRSPEAQTGYVSWRCRTHYKERKGVCPCFRKIVGFKWVRGRGEAVLIDIHGRVVSVNAKPPTPGVATITVGNKSLSVDLKGKLTISSAT